MTSLRNPVNVDISFNTTSVTQAGFGRPIFAAPHRYFPERVRGYGSIQSVAEDIPADTPVFRAMQSAFSQQPSPDVVYVGRQDVTQVQLTPSPVANNAEYTFIVQVGATTDTVTFQADASATAEEITDGLLSTFSALASSPSVTVTSVNGVLNLVEDGGQDFQVFGLNNLADTYTTTETASQLVNALADENNDWYFITAQDHSQDFVLAMAEAIEPMEKVYFTSSSASANLGVLEDPVVDADTFGKLANGNYQRTVAVFHQDAEVDYPELGYVSINAPYDAGSVVWANIIPSGIGVSTNLDANNRRLTRTERNNLNSKNANWVGDIGGNPVFRRGTASGGRFIDQTRGRDWLMVETRTELQLLLLNQRGGKISYTQAGLSQVESAISNAWSRGVARNFLTGFRIDMPLVSSIPLNDRAQYFLTGIEVTGFLAGGIIEIDLQGNLTFE